MEELRSSRAGGWKVANSGVAFDYDEVFGGLAGSCSIPFLELPPAVDDDSRGLLRSLGFDYGEIFGGFSEGELGVTYEELVAQPERPESSSENGRAPEEAGFVQTMTEVEFPPDVSDGDHFVCLNGEQFLSNSDHSDDDSTQFNMTFQKTSWGSREDAVNGATTEIAQLHRVPASKFVIDARSSLHDEVKDINPNMVNNDLQMDSNGVINDGNEEICPATSSGSSTQHSVTSREDQKPLTANDPAADVSTNVKHHSHSSSYHSTSSGDISYTDASYVTVSDISLRTRPLRVPPPSRPPPKLVNKQGIPLENMCTNSKADLDDVSLLRSMMNYQTRCDGSVPKEHPPQDNAKSSSFCVVEVDATSAAAASAAAMKEAMEQAQARLKSAKELMERKRDNAQSRKKFGHHDGIKYKERYGDKTAHQVQDLQEEMVQGLQVTFVNEDQNMNFAVGEWKKSKSRIATDHEEKERYADEKVQQTIQMEEFKSSHVLYDLAEGTGEQQKDKEFYELINNDKNFKIVREVTGHEGIEKKMKATAKSNRDKENDTKMPKRIRKLWEISDARGCEVKDKILRAGNVASSEKEIKEIPCSSPDVCVQKENVNKLNVNHDSHKQQENKEKIKLSWENSADKEEEEEMVFTEEASPGWKRGENLEPSKDAYKCEKDQRSEVEERRSEAKIFHGCEVHNEKDSNEPYVTCEPHVSKMKLKQANKSGILDIDTKEIRVPNGLSVAEVAEKLKEGQVASECETFEGGKRAAKLQCSIDENVNHLKDTAIPFDEQESENLNSRPEACHWVKNNEKLKVNEEAHALEENRKKPEIPEENRMELEISEEALGQTENEKKMDSAKEALGQDHRGRKAGEVEQNEKKQKHAQVICDLEVSAQKLKVAEGGHGHEEHGKNEEVQAANEPESKCNGVNETEDIFLRVANEFLETLQLDSLFKKKGDILVSAEDTTKSSETILAEKTIPDAREDDKKERESKMKKERQQEKEQSRKSEEEKEREREREKDRLAVERATREAHERALAEARERAERIAVERVTAEARQRALVEAREKAEKAASGALERSLTEKASREARLKAERAAVERATAEARERAVERVLAEKAVSDARERAERLNATSRDRLRKDYEPAGSFRASGKEASGTRMKTNSFDVPYAGQYQGVGSSSSSQRHSHNNVRTQKFEGAQTESALRSKARLERQQRTVERAAKALAEKNLRDILAQREQAERNRLAESLDAEIRRWSSGKEGNLRALLSTLQYILGSESGWQPIPLTDVITAAAAKKAYRKATLCVHPDKLQQKGASIQQKYICEKVFDLLKEAWNKFNSEER